MDTQLKNTCGGETRIMEPLKNDELHFESVFILDNGFEDIHPESISSNDLEEVHDNDNWDSPYVGQIESNFKEVIEEVEVPTFGCLTNEFTEESKVILKFGAHGSTVMLDEVHRKDDSVYADCEPLIVTETSQSNSTNSDTTEDSLLLSSSLWDSIPKIVQSFPASSQLNKDVISEMETKSLKLKQKEKYLSKSLNKIDEIIKNDRMRKSELNAKNKCNFAKKSSDSKSIKENKKICQQSELLTNPGPNFMKTPNVILNDSPKECNIDFLKNCIIEASRTLIKTNKSLRTLNKLLHSEVSIEKEEAIKHLKDFQFTFKSFQKRMNGIDNRLLTHYRNFIPSTENNPFCESVNKKISLGSLECNKSINDSKGLSNGGKMYEVINPIPKNEVLKRIKSNLKDKPKGTCNLKTSSLNGTSIEIESKKRRNPSNCSTSPKKIKTQILHQNWFTEKNNQSKPKPNEKHTISAYSLPPRDITSEPIIVLD